MDAEPFAPGAIRLARVAYPLERVSLQLGTSRTHGPGPGADDGSYGRNRGRRP